MRGPYLQSLLDTSVTVCWTTSDGGFGAVRYRQEGGPELIAEAGSPGHTHRVPLADLLPGTTYSYRVFLGDSALHEEEFRFRTAPPPGQGAVRVAVAGDTGTGDEDQQAVGRIIEGMAPDIFIHTGDLIYIDKADDAIFLPYRNLLARTCLYPCMGNHADRLLDWAALFSLPLEKSVPEAVCYSFDWGSAHFAALDTEEDCFVESPQLQWLERDLKAAKERGLPWTIVFFHKPPYSIGAYYYDPASLREDLVSLLDRLEVDLVLCGHDHNYQRTLPLRGHVGHDGWQYPDFISPRGTIYLVSGGGGAVLYGERTSADRRFIARFEEKHHALDLEIASARISVRAVSSGGEVIDEFSLAKDGPRPGFRFARGDADLNGRVDITDAIAVLEHLFQGMPLECPAAGSFEGAGELSTTDAVNLLDYLFFAGPKPAPPFPECGPAPDDDAWCRRIACRD